MSYLKQVRTQETFVNLANNEHTKRNRQSVINHFEKFCEKRYDTSMNQIFEDLVLQTTKDKSVIEDLLQNYISNGFEKMSTGSIKVHYSIVTRYLKYRGVSFDKDDVRTVLQFPRVHHEEKIGMTKDDIRKFCDNANQMERAKILVQSSSGLRNQEVTGLRKKDIQTDTVRWTIHVNSKIAKNNKARTTFLSNEARRFLTPILEKKNPDDRIFVSNHIPLIDALSLECLKFARLCKKCGLDLNYESSNSSLYTTHSLRAFFVTQAEKIHAGFGHVLAGHENYMGQYERYTKEDFLNFYLEVEPDLSIYDNGDSVGKDTRISNLERQVDSMKSYIDELTNRLDSRLKN
jgi:integrase